MPSPAEVIQALSGAGNDLYGFPGPKPPPILQIDAANALLLGGGGASLPRTPPRATPEPATGPVPQLPPVRQQVHDVLASPPGPGPGPGREMGDLFPHLYPPGDPNSFMTVQNIRQALDPSHVVARQPPTLAPQPNIGRTAPAQAPGPIGRVMNDAEFARWNMSNERGAPPPKLNDDDIIRALQQNPGASIFDVAGHNPQAPQPEISAPSVITRPAGFLRGSNAANALFDKHIAPHMDEETFANQYFAGMHSPDYMTFRKGFYDPNSLEFEGGLVNKNGDQIGQIAREINMDTGQAHHGYLKFYEKSDQGSGLAKQLLGNQIDTYNKLGLKSADLFANIDVGGYAWAKYGFLPQERDMPALQRFMNGRLGGMLRGGLDPELGQHVQTLINSGDPKALWTISDIKAMAPGGQTVGKNLLLNSSWNGKLNLKDPTSMDRFNAYVRP
jgi:hypothetical protein